MLADLTGADVAASVDLTGDAEKGGDWDLEYTTGSIETELVVSEAFQESFDEVLANTAPVLAGANDFTGIGENNTSSSGTLVSDLVSGQISDVDGGDSQGIAIVATDTINGTWEYTTDGSTWNSIGVVSEYSALLLASDGNNAVRFVPDANYTGTVTNGITFHAWDQTAGAEATKVDTTRTETVRDNFDTASYSNNDGTQNWNGDWVEVSDDGSATSGQIQIVDSQLRHEANNSNDRIYRSADLSGALTASLSFDYDNTLNNLLFGNKAVDLQVYDGDTGIWTTLKTYDEDNKGSGTDSFNISGYISSDTRIQLVTSTSDDDTNYLKIDN